MIRRAGKPKGRIQKYLIMSRAGKPKRRIQG